MTGVLLSYTNFRAATALAAGAMLLSAAAASLNAQTTGQTSDPPSWLIPIEDLNQELPPWLRFDGQYRNRAERPSGIGYNSKDDDHDLSRLRVKVTIQPTNWLKFVGEMQDSRIFGNQNVPSTPPYQNTFDIWQAYVQLGNASDGWFDILAGRQVLSFGEERLIGPADWLNVPRTFDAVRLDLHHTWFRLSLFSSAVVLARDGVIDHHYEGNNLHGAYGSLTRIVPHATLEPYVLWRVAPATLRLSENAGRGALSEATMGARLDGKLPGVLEYDVEMARQAALFGRILSIPGRATGILRNR